MRVLHIADIHGRTDFLEWSRSSDSPAHDVLALSGDFIDIMGREPVWAQRRDILDWLRAQRTPTVVCSGNHDLQWTPEGWEPSRWLRKAVNDFVTIDGGSLSTGGRIFHAVRWGKMPATSSAGGIVVMHQPPAGCAAAVDAVDGDNGDEDLTRICAGPDAPLLVLSGHVHLPGRWCAVSGRSVVVNPGCNTREAIPRHVLIDFSARTLEWRSAARTEGLEWPRKEEA